MRLGRRRLVIQRLKNTYKGLKLLDEGRDGENYRRLKNTYKGLKPIELGNNVERVHEIEEYL
jgi:hypothetical protein